MSSLTGIPRSSQQSQGGILEFYVTELENVTGATESNGVASFGSDAGVWSKFVVGKESGSNFVSTQAGDMAAGTEQYEQVLTAIFKRNSVSKRNELKVLGRNELVVVINDNDFPTSGGTVGNLYVIGLPVTNNPGGANVTATEMTTGSQFAESNMMTVTIRALESMPALSLSSSDYALIVAGSAVS